MKKKNSPNGPNNATRVIWAIIKSFVAVPGLLVVDVVDMVLLLPFFVLFLLLSSSVLSLSWWLVVCVEDVLAVTSGHMCVTCCVRIWKTL